MTDSPISGSEVNTTPTTPLATEMTATPATSLETNSEFPHISGLVKTTALMGTRFGAGSTRSPVLINSSSERMATFKTIMETETNPSTEASLTTLKTTSSSPGPHSSAPVHSESHKAISPMVIASTVEATNISSSTDIFPKSNSPWAKPTSMQTTGLREASVSQYSRSAIDTSMIPLQVSSAATTEVTRTEITSSYRISSPGSAQSMEAHSIPTGTSSKHFTSPATTESADLTFTMPVGSSRATSESALTLDTTKTASLEGIPSAVTRDFPLSEITTPLSRQPEAVPWTSPSHKKETRFLSSQVSVSRLTSISSGFSEVGVPRNPTILPFTSSLTLFPSSTNIHTLKTTVVPATGFWEDSSWSLSTAIGEDRTPEMTSIDITKDGNRLPTSDMAETTATEEGSPYVGASSTPASENFAPFTRPDESVVITTRELPREGAHGGTTWSTSDPTSPVTTINLDLDY
nr:mucin-16-like [Loxodonta africana]